MKVSIVHSFYRSAIPSGENIVVEAQARALLEAGHDVKIIGRHTDNLQSDPFYELKSAVTVATGQGADPLREIMYFSPDVVHVHNLFPNWGTRWLSRVEVPLVSTVHNFRSVCAAGTLLRDGAFCELCPTKGAQNAVKHSCYRDSVIKTLPLAVASRKRRVPPVFEHSDALIFLSERSRSTYESYGLGFPERAHVLPNFSVAPGPDYRNAGEGKEKYWVFVGRLSQEKGILELIRHWPPRVKLKVVGSGPQEAECRKEADGKDVVFFGQQDRERIDSFLSNATGLVFPSSCFENSPLIHSEALAHGLPVVALEGNSVADDVAQSQTGLVATSPEAFGHVMSEVEKRLSFFREAAQRRFQERFSQDKWVKDIESVYQELVSQA